jgi:hypothetical protein
VYASDADQHRIQVFRLADGSFLRTLGEGQLDQPGRLAISSERVIVTSKRKCVVFSQGGALLFSFDCNACQVACTLEEIVLTNEHWIHVHDAQDGTTLRTAPLETSGRAVAHDGVLWVSAWPYHGFLCQTQTLDLNLIWRENPEQQMATYATSEHFFAFIDNQGHVVVQLLKPPDSEMASGQPKRGRASLNRTMSSSSRQRPNRRGSDAKAAGGALDRADLLNHAPCRRHS